MQEHQKQSGDLAIIKRLINFMHKLLSSFQLIYFHVPLVRTNNLQAYNNYY